MRLIARTLIIVTAALLICGATYALAGSRNVQTAFPARPGRGENQGGHASAFTPGTADSAGSTLARPEGPGGEPGRSGGFGAIEVLQNLAIVGIIVVIVAPMLQLARRRIRSATPARALSDTPIASD